jgi:hypothetical protein
MNRIVPHGSWLTLTAALLLAAPAQARGPSPYLPLNLSPEIERQFERVLILADVPAMKRPFAAAVLLDALPKACPKDPALCNRVRRYLTQYMDSPAITHLSAELAYADSDVAQPLPNRHALNSDDSWQVSALGLIQPSDHIVLSLGAVADASDVTPTGTVLSLGFDFAQLDVGWREHWLSPMTDSSMLASTQGETMPSVTLSNYRPMTPLGITYEAFIAEMAHSENIRFGTGFTSGHPKLAGLSIGIEPVRGWSLGVSRVMQYGGGDRSDSLGDLFDAFFQPSKYDNVDDIETEQFGNQAAAFTSRFIFPGSIPFAAYFEYAGEDTSRNADYRLGNSALSAGIDFPVLWQRFDATYEVSEWQNAWYVNGVYGDGLANDGYVLGHWFGNQRVPGDAVGGQSHMVRVGWRPAFGGQFDFRYRTVQNEDYGAAEYTRGQELSASYAFGWHRFTVGAQLQAGRTVLDEDYARLAAFVRFADWIEHGGSDVALANDAADEDESDLFIDAGLSAGQVRVDLAGVGTERPRTDTKIAPHVGFGARRAVGNRHDLGVRIEADEADGTSLIAVRALDYRYRMGQHLAFTGFIGAARYDLATPAFGYYLGLGTQWRDILPRTDLSLDLRWAEKVARDKLLPSDPDPSVGRPDVFYDIYSAAVYLSYRW